MNKDIEELTQAAISGEEDALKVYAILKDYEKTLKKCINDVQPIALAEAENYSETTFSEHGYTFTKRNGGARYSFDNISEWVDKKQELKEIEERAKQAHKAYEKNLTSVSEDGEVIELPVVTYAKDSISVKYNG